MFYKLKEVPALDDKRRSASERERVLMSGA